MRLRNKNWTKEYINNNQQYMVNPSILNNANTLFKNDKNLFLEIGCGKGQFIINQAIKNSNNNYIAMEKETSVIGVALKKAKNTLDFDFKNLLFLNTFAENLLNIFEPNTFSGIYLNFSDPWPKAKHFKKRLTYIDFLNIYWILLKDNGFIEIKTDNDKLYEFSLNEIKKTKFTIVDYTNDLYNNNNLLINNVATEYEEKFRANGKNINKIVIKKEV